MAAVNAGRINHAEPGPIDKLVLTQQDNHRSETIWNRQDPGTLTCRSRSLEFSNREPMVDDRVVNIIKALGSTQKTWTEPVATPRGLPTPNPFPYTPHPSPSLTIPSSTSHPSPTLTIPSSTPHPSPTLTIPSPIPHPSSSFTIPSSTPHPSLSLTIPSSTPHPSPRPTTPSPFSHPSPHPTIPPPTPYPPRSDIRPPHPQSFPELSPIPSFYMGLDPTPPNLQQEPPSHSTSIAPSSAIDLPHVQAEQAVGLPAMAEGRSKRISKAPPCGTGGHKHGHNARPEASNEKHARPPPRYTR
nr:hypothetical protein CFP56_72773 [Quercus suber]